MDLAVRFAEPPSAAMRRVLADRGVWLADRPLATGAFLARGGAEGLQVLAAQRAVLGISSAAPSPFMRLLDIDMLEATGTLGASRSALAGRHLWLDGAGITIGDVDSDAWVFHPSLFHADGGAFGWIDTDQNGAFEVGVDAIDLNGNGKPDEGEIAHGLRVELRDLSFKEVDARTSFEPTRDYVFLDLNGNGTRDFGVGFRETDPGFGEPIFVADDADGDRRIGPTERLLRLGRSKFAAIRRDGASFVRGDTGGHGVIDYGVLLARAPQAARAPEHGTYVTSIIAGGGGSNRFRGIAPGADIALVTLPALADIQWLLEQPIASVSLPIGQLVGDPLDGSSELDRMVDAFWAKGIVASASVGNAGTARGHAQIDVAPGAKQEVAVGLIGPVETAYFSVVCPACSGDVTARLVDASGADIPAQTFGDTSPRGTNFVLLVAPASGRTGNFTLRVSAPVGGNASRRIHLYATSDRGDRVTFLDHVSAASTLGSPATADQNLAGTGFVLHEGPSYGFSAGITAGSLAPFASRGPRVDGRGLVALAAPVNPVGATFVAGAPGAVAERAWPGTSCASPEIAAAAALLRQAFPNETAAQLRARLLDSARRDATVTDDVNLWGAGKLDVGGAIGLPARDTGSPTASLSVASTSSSSSGARVVVHLDAHGSGSVVARWDLDYDGRWDTSFEAVADREVVALAGAEAVSVRVEVHDDTGSVVGATLRAPVASAMHTPPSVTEGGCSATPEASHPPSMWFGGLVVLAWRRRKRVA